MSVFTISMCHRTWSGINQKDNILILSFLKKMCFGFLSLQILFKCDIVGVEWLRRLFPVSNYFYTNFDPLFHV